MLCHSPERPSLLRNKEERQHEAGIQRFQLRYIWGNILGNTLPFHESWKLPVTIKGILRTCAQRKLLQLDAVVSGVVQHHDRRFRAHRTAMHFELTKELQGLLFDVRLSTTANRPSVGKKMAAC